MADIELVIKIDEEDYKAIKNMSVVGDMTIPYVFNSIRNGTPQPKDGKWIDYRNDGFVECPFCGHATNCEDNIDELHYCFYCGAKMVEPKESEDKNEQNKISG